MSYVYRTKNINIIAVYNYMDGVCVGEAAGSAHTSQYGGALNSPHTRKRTGLSLVVFFPLTHDMRVGLPSLKSLLYSPRSSAPGPGRRAWSDVHMQPADPPNQDKDAR